MSEWQDPKAPEEVIEETLRTLVDAVRNLDERVRMLTDLLEGILNHARRQHTATGEAAPLGRADAAGTTRPPPEG